MHCSKCGAVLAPDMAYCGNCGTLVEVLPPQANQNSQQTERASDWSASSPQVSSPSNPYDPTLLAPSFTPAQAVPPVPAYNPTLAAQASAPFAPPDQAANPASMVPVTPTNPNQATSYGPPPSPPVSETPFMSAGWSEFSSAQTQPPVGMPGAVGAYPPPPMPGMYPSATGYPNYPPGFIPPGYLPPAQPAPRSRLSPVVIALLVVVLLGVIFGSVVIGLRIGQAQNSTSVATPTVITASVTPTAAQLYQKVTSQTPSIVDSLQNATQSQWSVFERATYGCEIKSDGLHVHISDPQHFTYCTSGRGTFNNFAFQVTMKIVSGNGGGLTFRGDTLAGNLYYFHVYPDGSYVFYIEQKHTLITRLSMGNSSAISVGAGMQNTLTVIAQGNQIYLYVNGQMLTSVQDSTYTSGYLGVLVSAANAPAETVYTNARIWVL